MTVEKIIQAFKEKRGASVTRADVVGVLAAQVSGEWQAVHTSDLYQKRGGDYCTLLEVIASLAPDPMTVTLSESRNGKWSVSFWKLGSNFQLLVTDGYVNYEVFRYEGGGLSHDRDGIPAYMLDEVSRLFDFIHPPLLCGCSDSCQCGRYDNEGGTL